MYPLPAALVAVPDTVAAQFRAELMEQAVTIEAEFPDVEAVRKKWPTPPESHRIFVVGLKSFADLGDLQLLNASFPGWPILAMVESGRPWCSNSHSTAEMRSGVRCMKTESEMEKLAMGDDAQRFSRL